MSIHFDPVRPPIVLVIERAQVERQDTGELLKALLPMALTAETVREFAGRLQVVFDGYNDDPRETYLVPEIRQFIATVTQSFPYWFHFCDKTDDSMFVIMMCQIPITSSQTKDGIARTTLQASGMSALIGELFAAVNGLYACFGLSRDEQSTMTRQVGEYIRTFA